MCATFEPPATLPALLHAGRHSEAACRRVPPGIALAMLLVAPGTAPAAASSYSNTIPVERDLSTSRIVRNLTVSAIGPLTLRVEWTAASDIFDYEAKDDGNDQWWDLDLQRVERSALKVVLNCLVLVVATGFLCVLMAKTFAKLYDRFNLGVLAASTFVVANMLFISFWYQVNFGQGGEEKNDDEQYMVYRLQHHRTVVAVLSILFGLGFSAPCPKLT